MTGKNFKRSKFPGRPDTARVAFIDELLRCPDFEVKSSFKHGYLLEKWYSVLAG